MTDRSWKYNLWGTTFPPFDVAGKSHVFSSFIGLKAKKIVYIIVQIARSILSSGSVTQIDKEEVCFIFY